MFLSIALSGKYDININNKLLLIKLLKIMEKQTFQKETTNSTNVIAKSADVNIDVIKIGNFNVFGERVSIRYDIDQTICIGSFNMFDCGTVVEKNVYIGNCCTFGIYVHVNKICVIGNNNTIGNGTSICSGCRIGNNCSIGDGVFINECCQIGNNVTIGGNVTIPKGLTIPDGSVITLKTDWSKFCKI